MGHRLITLDGQSPSQATMPSLELCLMMITGIIPVRHMYSNAPARVGRRKPNYFLQMEQPLIILDIRSPSPATMQWWELDSMMTMELMQVRRMCSSAPARAGHRRQNYFLPMAHPMITLDGLSPSPATTSSWEPDLMMMLMELTLVRHMFSNAAVRVGRRKKSY